MPPYDPWYAGGQLNYYYFGFFMGAAFTKFTGVLPSISITLIVPLFFALTVAAAFSVVYNLAALVKRRLDENGGPRLPSPDLRRRHGRHLRHRPRQPRRRGPAPAGPRPRPPEPGLRLLRLLGAAAACSAPRATTASPSSPSSPFLFADPHAHLFVIPLTILAIGLALAFIVGSRGPGGRLGVMSWPAYIALGLTLGRDSSPRIAGTPPPTSSSAGPRSSSPSTPPGAR